MKPAAIWADPVTPEAAAAHEGAVFVIEGTLDGALVPEWAKRAPNVFPFPTRRGEGAAAFTDLPEEREAVESAMARLAALSEERTLLFSPGGLGVFSNMRETAPTLWGELTRFLLERFAYDNGAPIRFALRVRDSLVGFNTPEGLERAVASWYPGLDVEVYANAPDGLEIHFVRYLEDGRGGGRFVYSAAPGTKAKIAS